MSYVIAAPGMLGAAAADVAGIGSYNSTGTHAVMDSFVAASANITSYRGEGSISFSDDDHKAAMGQ